VHPRTALEASSMCCVLNSSTQREHGCASSVSTGQSAAGRIRRDVVVERVTV
jgi:hypothetical protein